MPALMGGRPAPPHLRPEHAALVRIPGSLVSLVPLLLVLGVGCDGGGGGGGGPASDAPAGSIAWYAGGCTSAAQCIDGLCVDVLGARLCLPECTGGACPEGAKGACQSSGTGLLACAPRCEGGASCPAGLACVEMGDKSVCALPEAPDLDACSYAYTRCDGVCVKLADDPGHCGDCTRHCAAGAACVSGMCICEDSTKKECGGKCVHTGTDKDNCGSCGWKCSFDNASAACISGKCALTGCDSGYLDCDHDDDTGCETEAAAVPTPAISVSEGTTAQPQTLLHASGSASSSPNGAVSAFAWTVQQPAESVSTVEPALTAEAISVQADVVGTYVLKLAVTDETGAESCTEASTSVVVKPEPLLYIQLTWTPAPAGEEGADLDLHLGDITHAGEGPDHDGDGKPDPWFDEQWDCYSKNQNPNWGEEVYAKDDPLLAREDSDGGGPEVISIAVPDYETAYQVAVYHAKEVGPEAPKATLKVFAHGKLVYTSKPTSLQPGDLWTAGSIDSEAKIFTPHLAAGGVAWVTPDYPAP